MKTPLAVALVAMGAMLLLAIQSAFFGLFNGTTEDEWGWLDAIGTEQKAAASA